MLGEFKVSNKDSRKMSPEVSLVFLLLTLNTFIMHNIQHISPFHATSLFLYPPETRGFLMFSGGMERDQWHEIG